MEGGIDLNFEADFADNSDEENGDTSQPGHTAPDFSSLFSSPPQIQLSENKSSDCEDIIEDNKKHEFSVKVKQDDSGMGVHQKNNLPEVSDVLHNPLSTVQVSQEALVERNNVQSGKVVISQNSEYVSNPSNVSSLIDTNTALKPSMSAGEPVLHAKHTDPQDIGAVEGFSVQSKEFTDLKQLDKDVKSVIETGKAAESNVGAVSV